MKAVLALVLATFCWSALAQTVQDQSSNTCEHYLMNRTKLGNILGLFCCSALRDIEDMTVWLDRYCPEHLKEHLAMAASKRSGVQSSYPSNP
jgi:histidinol dehydrogenase